VQHTKITLDPKVLDNYAGRYPINPTLAVTVTRDGTRLLAQATGQAPFELFAYAQKDFFAEVGDIEVSFHTGDDGKATEMEFRQSGQKTVVHRDGAPVKEHKEVAVDAAHFDILAGRYQAAPGVELTISREGEMLFAQLTGQPKFQIFAEGPNDYFLKIVDAQLTFQLDEKGHPAGLVLHQNGRDLPAKRVE
jgi:hypothetical protein